MNGGLPSPQPWCCSVTTPCPAHSTAYRSATPDEVRDYLAGHLVLPGAVETDHGLQVPA